MHVTDLCPKWLLNGEWAANRETRMCKHKEGNSGSQRVTLTRHRIFTPETTLFLPVIDNYHDFFLTNLNPQQLEGYAVLAKNVCDSHVDHLPGCSG